MRKRFSPESGNLKNRPGKAFRGAAIAGGTVGITLAISLSPTAAQNAGAPPTQSAVVQTKADPNKKTQSGQQSAGPTAAASGGAATAGPASDVAGVTIQDVVVRARLREESLQDVPVPITAVSGDDLEKRQQRTVKDFAQTSPSVTVNAPNARNTSIAIRGVGKSFANESLENSVGVIIDGVFVTLPGVTWGNFSDLESIELIRGPQGTLLGKNTTLGVLNITTKAPSFTPENEVELTYGNRDLFLVKGTSTGPLIDNVLAYRSSFYFDYQDELLNNSVFGAEDINGGANRWGGRFQLLFTPNSQVTNRTIVEHHESDEVGAALVPVYDPPTYTDNGATRPLTWTSRLANRFGGYTQPLDPFETADLDQQRATKSSTSSIASTTEYQLDNGFKFTSITSYRDYNFDALNDGDYTPFEIAQGGYLVDSKAASQEFRITSPKNQEVLGQKVDWQAGIYGLYSESDSNNRTKLGPDAGRFFAPDALYNAAVAFGQLGALSDSLNGLNVSVLEKPVTKHIAAYGQGTWHVTDQFDLTLGLRNTYEEKSNSLKKTIAGALPLTGPLAANLAAYRNALAIPVPDSEGELSDNSWSYLINPSYKLNENVLLYASYSRGEKSGAIQFDSVTGAPFEVDPEVVDNYEVGFKARLFNNALILNPNLFWTDIQDYQALTGRILPSNQLITYLDNIGGVRVRGVEVEGLYHTPIEGLRITFSGAYNDGVFTDYKDGQCPGDLSDSATTPPSLCDFSGQKFSGISRWVGNIGFDYSREIVSGFTGYAFATHTFRSRTNYGLSPLGEQDDYSITNAGIGIHPNNEAWDLSLWGKNVFDTEYFTFLGATTPTNPLLGVTGDPLQFGVTFRAKL
jgi:iron complex outermembrane receptor protein